MGSQLARNIQANEIFTKREYPDEKFISAELWFHGEVEGRILRIPIG